MHKRHDKKNATQQNQEHLTVQISLSENIQCAQHKENTFLRKHQNTEQKKIHQAWKKSQSSNMLVTTLFWKRHFSKRLVLSQLGRRKEKGRN
jgi:hypothetical protein